MYSPYSKKTQFNFDSPYKNSLYSSPQTPKSRYPSSQSSTPIRALKASPKTGYKLEELKDPLNEYQMKRTVRDMNITPALPSARASSTNGRDKIMMSTFSGFNPARKVSMTFNNTKSDGFFGSKLLADKEKWPEVNKTRTIFTPREETRPTMNFSSTPKISSGIPPRDPYYFRYLVGRGNNDQVVRRVMLKRYWWKEGSGLFHFSWQPTSSGIAFGNLNTNKNVKQVANHFERHTEISTKIGLIKNLTEYCEKHRLNIFDITPITYIIDLNEPNYREEFSKFLDLYKAHSKDPVEQTFSLENFFTQGPQKSPKFKLASPKTGKILITSMSPRQEQEQEEQEHEQKPPSPPKMAETMYDGANVWLLKPTEYNQGRGINVFNKLSLLDYYLRCLQRGIDVDLTPPTFTKSALTLKANKSNGAKAIQSKQYVIQKYLEKPLLIDNRKFDIRVWVLLDHEMNLYCFKEKYIRLSGEQFTLAEDKVTDKFVHLTNNAVQKYGRNYCKFESGNIISFHELKKYLPTQDPTADFNNINKKIKDIIKIAINAGKDKINPNERKFCFEIFGFDFILDAALNVWLIEINTNPSIDESNQLLSTLIPRMIDDAFRLTIDRVFVPTEENYRPEDARDFERQLEFPVNGYSSDENLWEQISNLRLVRINHKFI